MLVSTLFGESTPSVGGATTRPTSERLGVSLQDSPLTQSSVVSRERRSWGVGSAGVEVGERRDGLGSRQPSEEEQRLVSSGEEAAKKKEGKV